MGWGGARKRKLANAQWVGVSALAIFVVTSDGIMITGPPSLSIFHENAAQVRFYFDNYN